VVSFPACRLTVSYFHQTGNGGNINSSFFFFSICSLIPLKDFQVPFAFSLLVIKCSFLLLLLFFVLQFTFCDILQLHVLVDVIHIHFYHLCVILLTKLSFKKSKTAWEWPKLGIFKHMNNDNIIHKAFNGLLSTYCFSSV